MKFALSLTVLFKLISIQSLCDVLNECDYFEKIDADRPMPFMNPNFPGSYSPGVTCRWVFDCHVGHVCRLFCRNLGLPQTEGCYMDKLLVSTNSVDPLSEGSRVFCGGMNVNLKSKGSRISMMLMASESSLGGRLICTVRSEPTIHDGSSSRKETVLNLFHPLLKKKHTRPLQKIYAYNQRNYGVAQIPSNSEVPLN